MSLKDVIRRTEELRELLQTFGVRLSGFDPDVSGYLLGQNSGTGYFGEQLHFNQAEWKWLEPLLKELVELRREVKVLRLKLNQLHQFCPDHRDKQRERSCLACECEKLSSKLEHLQRNVNWSKWG